MVIRALIVDDEPLARRRVRSLLRADPEIQVVGECGDGNSAIAAIRELQPALVFLDVEMPEVDGFGVLRALDHLPTVVFVTAHQHYAVPAFEARALDYVLKPFKRSRFLDVLGRAKAHIRREQESSAQLHEMLDELRSAGRAPELLIVKSEGRILFLKTSQIDWIEAEKDYVRLYLGKENHLLRETMGSIHSRLDPEIFIRIHRSAIVNVNQIREVHPLLAGDYSVILRCGKQLSLSRGYRASLDRLLSRSRVTLPRSE